MLSPSVSRAYLELTRFQQPCELLQVAVLEACLEALEAVSRVQVDK